MRYFTPRSVPIPMGIAAPPIPSAAFGWAAAISTPRVQGDANGVVVPVTSPTLAAVGAPAQSFLAAPIALPLMFFRKAPGPPALTIPGPARSAQGVSLGRCDVMTLMGSSPQFDLRVLPPPGSA